MLSFTRLLVSPILFSVIFSALWCAPALLADPLTRVANTSLTLPATAPTEGSYTVVNAFGNLSFNSPMTVRTPRGETSYSYVVERGGKIQRVNLANNTKAEFLDLGSWVDTQGWSLPSDFENGFLSMAFHPNYQQNGHFFVFYTVLVSGQRHQRIARLTATGTAGNYLAATTCDPSTHVSLITQRDQAGNHNGGDLHFGADGYLYISVGDEGGSNDGYNNSNFINKDFFSAILRIDVDMKAENLTPNAHSQTNSTAYPSAVHTGTYKIPNNNPFIGETSHQGQTIAASSVRTEIWVTGLRNPWRFHFDEPTGRCFIADVGQNAREEINLVSGGEDCGWSRREGKNAFTNGPAGSNVPPNYSPHEPIYDYPRSDGRSITGGIVYRGSRLSELFGKYIFADYATSKVWSLTENNGVWERDNVINQGGIVGFGQDPNNKDILFCVMNQSYVGRLVRTATTTPAPATLSATGAFSSLSTLTPADGIYAYDVTHAFWSDHSQKRRWFSIPQVSNTMTFSAEGAWSYPTGQVWIKHFDLEMERGNPASSRRIETRFLVKTAAGAYGLSYRWREDGSEADLVSTSGLDESFTIDDGGTMIGQTWQYPSRANCLTCHTSQSQYALGFNTRQLNRAGALGNDQLDQLACAGFFDAPLASSKSLPAHPALNDATASRESRLRAYLDVNCAMCHYGNSSPVPGNFDARATTRTDLANIINGLLINNLGDTSNRFIVPNDIAHSVVLKKLDGSAGKMPPLSSTVVDQDAVDLITAWITQDLPGRLSYSEWAQDHFGETGTARTIESGDYDSDGQNNGLEFLAATDPTQNDSIFHIDINAITQQFSFTHPANRYLLIETSTDLLTWVPYEHADNSLLAPATNQNRTYTLPSGEKQFIRARLDTP